jgi:hypothetical protein
VSDIDPRHSDSGQWDPAACQAWREEAAVALLSRRVIPAPAQHHLDECPPCQDEIDELTALTPLLTQSREPAATARAHPSDLMLPRLLAETSRLRRRRRLQALAGAAAVIAIALPVGFAVGRALAPSLPAAGPGATVQASAALPVLARGEALDPVSGTRVEVELRAAGSGSRVDVELYSIPGGAHCHVTVIDRAARRIQTQGWVVPKEGYVAGRTYPEIVALEPGEVAAVDLVDDSTERVMAHIPLLPV